MFSIHKLLLFSLRDPNIFLGPNICLLLCDCKLKCVVGKIKLWNAVGNIEVDGIL